MVFFEGMNPGLTVPSVLPYSSQGLVLYGLALVARSLKGSLIFEPMTTPMPRTRYEGIQTL